MSRKKLILSITLLATLVAAGIILPSCWRMEHRKNKHYFSLPAPGRDTKKEPAKAVKPSEPSKPAERQELSCEGFDSLKDFFPEYGLEEIQALFVDYFTGNDNTVTSVTFQPEQTEYPDGGSTILHFSLSDGTDFPVTYNISSGSFFFGKEKKQVSTGTQTYERKTDDKLPSYSSDEIFSMQEGGYADTPDDEPDSDDDEEVMP